MKYIKHFESMYSDKEIEDDMNDYLLPLHDKEFYVDICAYTDEIVCQVIKFKNGRPIMYKFSEIKEEVCGLINFVKQRYNIDISEIYYNDNDAIKDISIISDNESIDGVEIYFLKNN